MPFHRCPRAAVRAAAALFLLVSCVVAGTATAAKAPRGGDTVRPSTPEGLGAEVLNDRVIQLTWLPSTDNVAVAGYIVYDRNEPIADVPTPTFTHYRLRANSTYRYSVRAYDTSGNLSLQPPQLVVETGDTTPPRAPTEFASNQIGENSVKLTWNAAVDNVGIDTYTVQQVDGPSWTLSGLNLTIDGLTVATEYLFTVSATDRFGNVSPPSPVLSYTTPDLTRPLEPEGLAADVLSDSRILLTWDKAFDNVAIGSYEILNFGELVGTSGGTKFIHSGLEPETQYKYRIRSVDTSGNRSNSVISLVVNTGDTTPPTTPDGFAATVLNDTTIRIDWEASVDNVAVDRYELYEGGELLEVLDDTAFVHDGLTPVTTYEYTLVAFDDNDNASAPAGVLSPNTGDTTPPTTPGAYSLALVDDSTLELAWLPSTDNVELAGYEVLADGAIVATPTSNGVELTGLSPVQSRSYTVRAVDHFGLRSAPTAPIVASPTDDTSVPLLDETLVPIVGALNVRSRPEPEQALEAGEIDAVAEAYHGLWGSPRFVPTAQQMDELRALKPGFRVLAYLNSSHTTSNESDTLAAESLRIRMINVYLEAYLDEAINATDTELRLRVADTERGWGLIASTIPGEFTTGALEYVTFVRIDDELMRIEAVDAQSGTITVTRGFQGTPIGSHPLDAEVFAPVYTGPGDTDGLTQSIPGNDADLLPAYSLQVGTVAAANFFGDKAIDIMASGVDGNWLDICSPEFFNQVNALGEAVVPWNLETGAEFTVSQRRAHQDRKLGRMQARVLGATGQMPQFTANNNANGKYFEAGGRAMDFLLPTDPKPDPIQGVILEAAFSEVLRDSNFTVAKWQRNLSTVVHGGQNGLPVWPWIKTATGDYREDSEVVDAFELFDYASVLLGWELNTAEAFITMPLFRADGDGRALNLSDWFFYDMGEPEEQVAYDALEQLRVPDTNTYLRRWSNGVVLVNPTATDDPAVPLPGQYLVPGEARKVTSIGVPAYTAYLLIADE